MTIQEEAEALVNEFFNLKPLKMDDRDAFISWPLAKQCALLHLDKMNRISDSMFNYDGDYFTELKEAVENL